MTSTGTDPQNGLKLTQLNAATASAGNTDGCLTGHLSEEGVGLMPQSTVFPSFALSQFLQSALDPSVPYASPVGEDRGLYRHALLYGLNRYANEHGIVPFDIAYDQIEFVLGMACHERIEWFMNESRHRIDTGDEPDYEEHNSEFHDIVDDGRSALRDLIEAKSISWVMYDCEPAIRVLKRLPEAPTVSLRAVALDRMKSLETASGYVYLMRCNTRFKIGITRDLSRRIRQLNGSQAAYPIDLVFARRAPGYEQMEAWLHERFSDKRAHSEWFELNQDDVNEVVRLIESWSGQSKGGAS